jgi:hypothetical protein
MPKRGPIVPVQQQSAPKKKKKVKKQPQIENDSASDTRRSGDKDNSAATAAADDVELLTVDASSAEYHGDKRGLDILTEPDRADKAERFLRWLLFPLEPAEFLTNGFGKRPVLVARSGEQRGHFKGCFSTGELERQLTSCELRWTDEVDAAKYAEGKRTTHNGEGVARASDVLARYREGCSIRLSWPQHHSEPLWGMLEQLEEFFGSGSGANVYATPPGSQGFAPHWDDIDAFVLQVEGEKRWRLYAPRSPDEANPRFSSPNLPQDELGALIEEVTLRPGDLLYLPRGIVHQATCSETASLHVTASVGRQHAWRDLLEVGVLGALEASAMAHPEWRESLPIDLSNHMGIIHKDDDGDDDDEGGGGGAAGGAGDDGPSCVACGGSLRGGKCPNCDKADLDDSDDDDDAEGGRGDNGFAARRGAIQMRLRTMLHQLVDELPLDAMVDQFVCQRFLFDRMPPRLAPSDAARRPIDPAAITLDSKVRLTSRRVARLAAEEGLAALYFSAHNTREFHGHAEPQHIDFAPEAAPALEAILKAYPKYLSVSRLPGDDDEQRVDVARALVEAKVLLLRPEGPQGGGGKKKQTRAKVSLEAAGSSG